MNDDKMNEIAVSSQIISFVFELQPRVSGFLIHSVLLYDGENERIVKTKQSSNISRFFFRFIHNGIVSVEQTLFVCLCLIIMVLSTQTKPP